nr:hypothetical protein [uncultured Albidiferax sp.]
MYTISDHQIRAFRRFYELLPRTDDAELLVLKVHLLIEEQIRLILHERFPNAAAAKKADLTCYQAICIAEGFCSEDADPKLWDILKKLNKLRNDIAHNLEPKGMTDQMSNIVKSVLPKLTTAQVPELAEKMSPQQKFSFAASMLMARVASLVMPPSKRIEHSSANDENPI